MKVISRYILAESATMASPLTPSELLVALHGIECDIKAVMKGKVLLNSTNVSTIN